MQDSLKTILYEAIKAKYPDYLPLSEVERICKEHNRKISNGERRLRKSESPTVIGVKNSKGAIIGYKYIPIIGTVDSKTGTINFDKPKTKMDILDEKLDDLLKTYQNQRAWQNYEAIREIKEAIKRPNEYLKQSVIKKYQDPINPTL